MVGREDEGRREEDGRCDMSVDFGVGVGVSVGVGASRRVEEVTE